MKYDPKTNQNTVLLKDLFFPNGVILSPNEDFLLISESGQNRILRYYLKGPKKFTSDVFFDGLPGSPDNLRSNGENGLFVPLVLVKNENYPLTLQSINDLPLLRKFLARFMSLTELLLHKIYSIQPNDFVKRAIHTIGHMESILPLLAYNITLIELNWNGDFVKSYQGSDGSFSFLSDVVVHNDYLYLGSPTNTFLGRIKLSKLGDISTFKPKSSTKSIPAAPPATPKPQQQTTVPSPSTTAVPPRTTTKAKSQITSPPPAANPTTTTNNRPKTNSPPPTPAPKPTNQQNRNPNH